MEVPVHAGSGGLACAAGHARAAKGLAAGHQLAFGAETGSYARQERLGLAGRAVSGWYAISVWCRLCFTRGAYVVAFAASARSFSRAAGFLTGICYGGF